MTGGSAKDSPYSLSLFTDALRPAEQAKIDCGREHFKALGTDVGFTVADSYETFSEKLSASCLNQGRAKKK